MSGAGTLRGPGAKAGRPLQDGLNRSQFGV
jgi:hypothetical protein